MKRIQYDETAEIYHGDRTDKFKELILTLLNRSGLYKEDKERLLILGMPSFAQAFTSRTAAPILNYEYYEQIGDMYVNTFIVNYAYARFPQLKTPAGVQIVARIRIKYGSRENLYQIGEKLGFWQFISASVQHRHDNRKSLIEDTFEAIMGSIAQCIDDFFAPTRCGYKYVYNILSSIFDEIPISLKYIDLYDRITILKETFDYLKDTIGKQSKEYKYDEETQLCMCRLYRIHDGKKILIGTGWAARQPDAEQRAASDALELLHKQGLQKPEPQIFNEMAKSKVEEETYGLRLFSLHLTDTLEYYYYKYFGDK